MALNPTIEIELSDINSTVTLRQLPYGTSYLIKFDKYKTPFYEIVFAHQIIGVYIFGWFMGHIDTIANGLIIHLTAQFKIVANAFKTIKIRAEELSEVLK